MEARVFTDERCGLHQPPMGFPECPERLSAVLAGARQLGVPVQSDGATDAEREAADAALRAVHSEDYLRRLDDALEAGDGFLDSADNPLSPGTGEAARGAVEATLTAADWLWTESDRMGFAAVRPPGHHARPGGAMGFCYYNNVAVAAEHLLRQHRMARLAIIDLDVHHGNGTQEIFYRRPDVFYGSMHQYPFYPGTGAAAERGADDGLGGTLNLPLPAGTGDAEWLAVLRQRMLPALSEFAPQLLLVSLGFDAWREDPLAGLLLSEEAFRRCGALLKEWAASHTRGRLLVALEGGYDVEALPSLTARFLQGLTD